MDETATGLLIIAAAIVGVIAVLAILREDRRQNATVGPNDRQIAASTEGATICPRCAGDNLWSDDRCIHCGAKLR